MISTMTAVLTWVLMAVSSGLASTEGLFRSCVKLDGDAYEQAAARFLARTDTREFLEARAADPGPDRLERPVVRILISRLDHPAVFAEFRTELREWRESGRVPDRIPSRPGLFLGRLRTFAKRGPESKVVEVWGKLKPTKRGWRHEKTEVEKYTEEEVERGKARNRAARLALLELFLKGFGDTNDYEQLDLIHMTREMSCREHMPKPSGAGGWLRTLLEVRMRDATLSWPVRIAAAVYVPGDDRSASVKFLIEAFASEETVDRDHFYGPLYDAGTILAHHGTRDDIENLRELELDPPWKRKLIESAARDWERIHR